MQILFYNLKMLTSASILSIIALAFAIFLLFLPGLSLLFFLPFYFVAIILVLLIGARKTRINSMFITEKHFFSKWNDIFQLPDKKCTLKIVGAVPCDTFYKSLMKAMYQMSNELGQPGYYRTITHSSVKRILQHRARQDKIKLIKCVPAYQRSFVHLQKQLLRNRCKGCPDNKDCPYYQDAPRSRQFYYIEFQIPIEMKDGI